MRYQILVTRYNCDISRCIQSIISQSHRDWVCHIIDDASSDEGLVPLEDDRFIVHRNKERTYCIGNYAERHRFFRDEEVVITVDGDDYLPDDDVFRRIDEAYKGDVWATYGTMMTIHGEIIGQDEIWDPMMLREYPWVPSQLRSWKAGLWKKIKDVDLRDESGYYFTVASDLAFFYPILEMAFGHVKYLREVNYVYNVDNPISNHHVRPRLQKENDRIIRSKPSYVPKLLC